MMNDTQDSRPSRYRYSDAFIRRASIVLVCVMFGGLAVGLVVGLVADEIGGDIAETVSNMSGVLMVASMIVPLLISAFLGGLAIHRHGWVPPLVMMVGAGPGIVGVVSGQDALAWGGLAVFVLGGAGYFYLGNLSKVPMWLQLPIIGSPRFYLSRERRR